MTPYLSKKIMIFNSLLIIMVVYIHSGFSHPAALMHPSLQYIQRFVGLGLFRIANCMFFMFSGFLLAKSVINLHDIFIKQLKRIRTLLIPFILWNLIFVLFYIFIESIPQLSSFNNQDSFIAFFHNESLGKIGRYLFLKPAAFQLWFLRDLIVFIALSPIVFMITKKSPIVATIGILCLLFLYSWASYFWIGILISTNKPSIAQKDIPLSMITCCSLIYLLSCIYVASELTFNKYADIVIMAFSNTCGIIAVWAIYDRLENRLHISDSRIVTRICGFSFFIYVFHEPTFNIIKKLSVAIIGNSEPALIFLYFLNPWLMVIFAIIVARILIRFIPGAYKILTGGR